MTQFDELSEQQRDAIQAATFRHLVQHLRDKPGIQNIELMNLADFCRNCLSKWLMAEASQRDVELDYEQARRAVYGMPYGEWKERYQTEATSEQKAAFDAGKKSDSTGEAAGDASGTDFGDPQLLRYSRQIMLPSLGLEGQARLLDAHVLLIGLGGLGSPVAMYLAACGVGNLTVVDGDKVELLNLQRQILYRSEDLGREKAEAAKQVASDLNPDIKVTAIPERLDNSRLHEMVGQADVVLDATDNFESRLHINKACVEESTPLVSAAVIRMEGQVTVFRNQQPDDVCYQCLFGDDPVVEERCSELGVLGPVAGTVGCVQATEAIKCLLDIGSPLYNRLLLFDAPAAQWQTIELTPDPECPICRPIRT